MLNLLFLLILNTIMNLLVQFKIIFKGFAYINILLTSILIIFIGIKYFSNTDINMIEDYINEDIAYLYPFILSIMLVTVYIIIKYLGDYKEIILSLMFFTSITTSLYKLFEVNYFIVALPILCLFIFNFLTKGKYNDIKLYINNIIAILVGVSAIKIVAIEDLKTAMILLSGLFFFDIFWVFGSKIIAKESVMETVALNVDYPVLLKFFNYGKNRNTMLLGLGDIIIPALFIKTLVNLPPYYNLSYVTYVIGLISSMVAAIIFEKGQPALLYIVPALILPILGLSKIKGDKIL